MQTKPLNLVDLFKQSAKYEDLFNFIVSSLTFLLSLIAIVCDFWATTNNGSQQFFGLWRGQDFTKPITKNFNGVEVVRGTAVIAICISLVTCAISTWNYWVDKIKYLENNGNFNKYDFTFGNLFLVGSSFSFGVITASIYTNFVCKGEVSLNLGFGFSLCLFWAVNVFNFLHWSGILVKFYT